LPPESILDLVYTTKKPRCIDRCKARIRKVEVKVKL
jgi:hypothetical protein